MRTWTAFIDTNPIFILTYGTRLANRIVFVSPPAAKPHGGITAHVLEC
jgi:hypothetical protein